MKYIKTFESQNIDNEYIKDKFIEILNLIKEEEIENNNHMTINTSPSKYNKKSIMIFYKDSADVNNIEIEISKDYINNTKILISTIYFLMSYPKNVNNIILFLDFFENMFNQYIIYIEKGQIELKIPNTELPNFYKKLNNFYIYYTSNKYNL